MADVQNEAARLYRAARRGDIESDVAARLATILRLVYECARTTSFEDRLNDLEKLLESAPITLRRAA